MVTIFSTTKSSIVSYFSPLECQMFESNLIYSGLILFRAPPSFPRTLSDNSMVREIAAFCRAKLEAFLSIFFNVARGNDFGQFLLVIPESNYVHSPCLVHGFIANFFQKQLT